MSDICLAYANFNESDFHTIATTGPKDIIIMIDISPSMSNSLNEMKLAAIKVINSLTLYDYMQIVIFNTDASSQGSELIPVTEANRTILID